MHALLLGVVICEDLHSLQRIFGDSIVELQTLLRVIDDAGLLRILNGIIERDSLLIIDVSTAELVGKLIRDVIANIVYIIYKVLAGLVEVVLLGFVKIFVGALFLRLKGLT